MRSALCALAPSHPFRGMPPRITRNSYRPRASDRTMVDTESPTALAALANPTASHRPRRNHENGLTKLHQGSTVGWISRNTLDLRSEEKFFLDIPFYRTHCPGMSSFGITAAG